MGAGAYKYARDLEHKLAKVIQNYISYLIEIFENCDCILHS